MHTDRHSKQLHPGKRLGASSVQHYLERGTKVLAVHGAPQKQYGALDNL